MKKLSYSFIILLILASYSFAQTPRGAYDYDKTFRNEAITQNVWDTIYIGDMDYQSKAISIRCKSGSIKFSFSQGNGTDRDTVSHLDSMGAGQDWEYTNRISKYLYITGSGGNAVVDVFIQYGTGTGTLKSGGSSSATPNLYGYAYKDSLNTFTQFVQLPPSIDTSDFTNGPSGSVTSTGQVNAVVIMNPTIPTLSAGILTVTNSNVSTNSIITATLMFSSHGTSRIEQGTFISIEGVQGGTFDIKIFPSLGDLSDEFWIYYTIN